MKKRLGSEESFEVFFKNAGLKNLLPFIIRDKSVRTDEEKIFLILRVDTNILLNLWRADGKVLLQIWAGRGASITISTHC
jgi:hypothetical protein